MSALPMLTKTTIIDKCVGCKKVTEDNFCEVYINTAGKGNCGGCGISTHISKVNEVIVKKMNPLKASKKMKKKK